MPCAMSAASSSGCLISWMLSWMFAFCVMRPRWRRRRSASCATAADDDAGTGGVHVDAKPVTRALDLDPAHRGRLELGRQVVADLPVLDHRVLVAAVVEPARLPVRRDAEPEPVGVDLLTHQLLVLFSASSPSAAVARRPRPRRRRSSLRHRLSTRVGVFGLDASTSSASVDLVRRSRRLRPRVVADRRLDRRPRLDRLVVASSSSCVIGVDVARRRPPRPRSRLATTGPGDTARTAVRGLGGDAGTPAGDLLVGHAGEDDRDVAGALADARRTTTCAGPPALQRRALVGVAGGDVELVGIEPVVVLGVRRRTSAAASRRPAPRRGRCARGCRRARRTRRRG